MNRIFAFVFVCLAASYSAAQLAADDASLAAIEGNSETERQAKAVRSVELPDRNPVELKVFARLGPGPAKENSGIVKSRQHADVFWMHNDSGDEPRIYPIRINGEVYKSERYPGTPGVLIGGAINVDWEDIAVDNEGHVIVADFGNGQSDRRESAGDPGRHGAARSRGGSWLPRGARDGPEGRGRRGPRCRDAHQGGPDRMCGAGGIHAGQPYEAPGSMEKLGGEGLGKILYQFFREPI